MHTKFNNGRAKSRKKELWSLAEAKKKWSHKGKMLILLYSFLELTEIYVVINFLYIFMQKGCQKII